jgi:hypothetical protein
MKILSFGVTQHFTDEVDWILDLAIGVRLPPLDDDNCINHITCSEYVQVQDFIGFRFYQSGWGCQILLQFFEGLLCLLNPLELVLFLDVLKEMESPDAELLDKPAQSSHTSRQLLHAMEALRRLYFGDSGHLL